MKNKIGLSLPKIYSMDLEAIYEAHFCREIGHRYFPQESLLKVLNQLHIEPKTIGYSFLSRPIYHFTLGEGNKNVLFWTQMHGNESTGTRALLDFIKFLKENKEIAPAFLRHFSFHFIPILNPDGAALYTRENAAGIDINRDFLANQSPEIKILKEFIKQHHWEALFNLHDQRTIFNPEGSKKPATLSFLAASGDAQQTLTPNRKETMGIIAAMYRGLNKVLAEQIGRYKHDFYPRATGDNFTHQGYRCVLIESGHYPNDLNRNITRKYNFMAFIHALQFIQNEQDKTVWYEDYFCIPDNKEEFLDVVIRNVKIQFQNQHLFADLGIFYKDIWDENTQGLNRVGEITQIGDLAHLMGHEELDAQEEIFQDLNGNSRLPQLHQTADFMIGNKRYINGVLLASR